MTTYYMFNRFTGELACVFQARSYVGAVETYRLLDGLCRHFLTGLPS
jgi:hypothetical protein